MSKVTMQMIADRIGISKVSVSKALNGQPGISPGLRRKIQETALEMGYTRQGENGQKRRKLAFVVPKRFFLKNENFYTTIYYYLNRKCQISGQALSNFVVDNEEEKDLAVPALLSAGVFEGIFIAGEIDEKYLNALVRLGIPIVLIDFYKASVNLDCIISDNFYLGYCATVRLLENGHRKIGFVGDTRETASIMDRYYGYCKALRQSGLPVDDRWHIVNNDPRTGVYSLDLALPEELPTAFVCHCDMAAHFLMQSLAKAGLSVPRDVSLVSFDNTDLSRFTAPKLSTFNIDRRKIALEAFNRMMGRLADRGGEPQRIYVDGSFISRESIRKID